MAKKLVETTNYSLSAEAPVCPDRRADERYVSLLRVGALTVDGRRELCLIRNISAGGMMIRPYSPIPVGAQLSVELKQGDSVSGIAQWTDSGMVGVVFDEPLAVVVEPDAPRGEVTVETGLEGSSELTVPAVWSTAIGSWIVCPAT